MRVSGLAREQESSSSSQSPFQLLVFLQQALSSLRFGKKDVTEEQNILVAEAGILLSKILCVLHSGNPSA